jgi:hypothetical protein
MCYLIDLAIYALDTYKSHHTEEDHSYIDKKKVEIEDMDWDDIAKYKKLCKYILAGLEIVEKEGFEGLSRARIGDVRSMMSDLRIRLIC